MSAADGPVIFSLTDAGRRLAERLHTALPDSTHQHRPAAFADAARDAFAGGRRCVFVCATGIVVRVLAPVLAGKHRDPAVLVLDEAGRFVIPLLSGHEGGGCAFGRTVADAIGARLVVTSATDYSRPVHCIGVGTDRGCPPALLDTLFDEVAGGLEPAGEIVAVASIDRKRDEPAVVALAGRLGVPLHCYSADELRSVEDRLSARSEIVFRETGCYGVAEAAALLGAEAATGQSASLVVPKRKNTRATLAVAVSHRPVDDDPS